MIAKCTKCHHESQQVEVIEYIGSVAVVHPPDDCSWCGAPMEKIASDYMDARGSTDDIARPDQR